MLLAFLCVGMLCGEDGILGISFNDYQLTENVCTAALILIIFYGGFGTKWSAAKPVAGRAILLSTVGVFLTAAAVGSFCHIVLHVGLLESLLIGSVISSTDAASVFSILRAKKLNLKYGTASLLEVESGSNDPIAYLMVTIVVAMMETSVSAGSVLYQVFAQIVFGVGIGAELALVVLFFLRRFQFDTSGFDLVFMLAVAILSYVVPTMIGGNGYLSAYIAGIILGKADLSNKKNLVHFFHLLDIYRTSAGRWRFINALPGEILAATPHLLGWAAWCNLCNFRHHCCCKHGSCRFCNAEI